MTQEERDQLAGKVQREYREAESDLNATLVKAEHTLERLNSLTDALCSRIDRARRSGNAAMVYPGYTQEIVQDAPLSQNAVSSYPDKGEIVDLDALLTAAAAKVARLKEQKRLMEL